MMSSYIDLSGIVLDDHGLKTYSSCCADYILLVLTQMRIGVLRYLDILNLSNDM